MALTVEKLHQANDNLKTVAVKGKAYAMVQSRITALRSIIPGAEVSTEIVNFDDNGCIVKATIKDDKGNILATGHAWELSTSSQVNRTSYVENCETSAVGRALAFCGIGVDKSIASYEEVSNAIEQQEAIDEMFNKYSEIKGITVEEAKTQFTRCGITSTKAQIDKLTKEIYPKTSEPPKAFERSK